MWIQTVLMLAHLYCYHLYNESISDWVLSLTNLILSSLHDIN